MKHAKLKGRMRELGVTQEELARATGLSTVSINLKLNEKRDFTAEEIRLIMDVLKIENPVEYFLYERVGQSLSETHKEE